MGHCLNGFGIDGGKGRILTEATNTAARKDDRLRRLSTS